MGRLKILLVLALVMTSLLMAGCSGEGESASASKTPEAEKPVGSVQLHGVGKCDQCHDAYPVGDIAAGLHKTAFTKQPDIHKNLCSECHDVNTFCGKCHEVPDIVK